MALVTGCRFVMSFLCVAACGRAHFELLDPSSSGGDAGAAADADAVAGASWYDPAWTNRSRITVLSARVGATLVDFPVYVDLAHLGPSFFAGVESAAGDDGGDIRITKADGTSELPREIVSIDVGAGTGELYLRADTLSSAQDTSFFLYYGNAAATEPAPGDAFGRQNVWANGYRGVWHLNDATTATVEDSSGNQPSGTKLSANNPSQIATGQTGAAQAFTNDKIDFVAYEFGVNFTISAWVNVNPAVTELCGILADSDGGGDTDGFRFFVNTFGTSDGMLSLETGNGMTGSRVKASTAAGTVRFGQWEHVAVTADRTIGTAVLYRAGVDATVDCAIRTDFMTSSDWELGSLETTFLPMNGGIDEVRISNTIRSAPWIAAEHANQSDPASFYRIEAP